MEINEKEVKLKDCPFCGSEAILETELAWPDVYILCKSCFNCTNHFDHWEKAYKAWNMRPNNEPEQKKVSVQDIRHALDEEHYHIINLKLAQCVYDLIYNQKDG